MMLTSYFDESVDETGEFIVVAGWVANVDQWQRFECDWKLFLAKYGRPYLHMREYTASTGAFKDWKGKEGTRSSFISDAASIVSDFAQRGFACFVAHDTFKNVDAQYELHERIPSPTPLWEEPAWWRLTLGASPSSRRRLESSTSLTTEGQIRAGC